MNVTSEKQIRPELQKLIAATVTSGCTSCGKCVKECAFLKKYGTPNFIADGFDAADTKNLSRPFECSLCGLCTTVCPERLDLDGLFLEMRREAVDRGFGDYPEHKPLLNYERLGTSRRFTLYRLPRGCTTVFFPGCSLSGTRPDAVNKVFDRLRQVDPAAGIVFDCCLKPSHSLGREQYTNAMFGEMNDWLVQQGVKEVLVACPNCQVMFATFGRGLKVRTVWEVLAGSGEPLEQVSGTVTVHDPCVIRDAQPAHQAVRTLLKRQGLKVEEMPHSGRTTICCGQGGAVNLLDPQLSASWGELRKKRGGRQENHHLLRRLCPGPGGAHADQSPGRCPVRPGSDPCRKEKGGRRPLYLSEPASSQKGFQTQGGICRDTRTNICPGTGETEETLLETRCHSAHARHRPDCAGFSYSGDLQTL